MRTILVTAYAINPYKGSEDGTGWNFICQIARHQRLIAVTRENNREFIEKYLQENGAENADNMQFEYFDLPYWMRFWKKGGRGALLYFWMWQAGIVGFIKKKKLKFDIAHNLNFHNDWTPSFLWRLKKPFVWGPVGHHPLIPQHFILPEYGRKAWVKDRLTWLVKNWFWRLDPFLFLTKKNAAHIVAMHTEAVKKLEIPAEKYTILPAVGTEDMALSGLEKKPGFHVLSVGRYVFLKGFDVTIRAFAGFYDGLEEDQKEQVSLTLIGSGPETSRLKNMITALNMEKSIRIVDWMKRDGLKWLMSRSSLFLYPSHEGAGMVVAEAMSCSLPVVCFDNCGPGEFVTDECGMRIPYGTYDKTIEAFSAALHHFYTNPEKLEASSKAARARFENYFNWNNKAKSLKEIYDRIA